VSVLKLSDYRKTPFKKRPNDLDQKRYFCLKCDSDQFKLMADGDVYCASCTARARNLRLLDIT
jgi:hypothetical protein